jgi:hypothetical protein
LHDNDVIVSNSVRKTTAAGVTSTVGTQLSDSSFDNDNLHTVRIVYESKKSRLFVYLDGTTTPHVVNIDIASTLGLDTGGKAWIGLGSSTGDLFYGEQWIRSWTFSQGK